MTADTSATDTQNDEDFALALLEQDRSLTDR